MHAQQIFACNYEGGDLEHKDFITQSARLLLHDVHHRNKPMSSQLRLQASLQRGVHRCLAFCLASPLCPAEHCSVAMELTKAVLARQCVKLIDKSARLVLVKIDFLRERPVHCVLLPLETFHLPEFVPELVDLNLQLQLLTSRQDRFLVIRLDTARSPHFLRMLR